MQTKIRGIKSVSGVEVDLKATEGGVLHTLPYSTILTAKGYGYEAMSTAAVAALVARPSTLSLATLWNGEAGGGKVYVMERAFAHCLVSTAAEGRFAIWLCIHPVGKAAVIADITAINNTRGIAGYGGNARFDLDATVVADGWFPWSVSQDVEPTGVLPGAVAVAEIGGRIIIPPTAAISIQVVASLVTETFVVGFHWFEVPQTELGIA